MGSPASRLDIPEHLRPWYDLGLEYVLNPKGVVEESATEAASERRPAHVVQQSGQQEPVQPGQVQPQHATSQNISHQQSWQARPTTAPPVSGLPFPSPWDRFASMASEGARVMITYAELGHDLTGNADPARGKLLRSLLAYLKWPKGTAMFWPCTLPQKGNLVPQTAMFWSGVERFRCSDILCFGPEAVSIVYPQAQHGQTFIMLEHATLHLLPSVSDLLGKLPHEQQLAVASLTNLRL